MPKHYSLAQFRNLRAHFKTALTDAGGEPKSCQLYSAELIARDLELLPYPEILTGWHIAEACNLAGVISAVGRILSLPRSNVACEELSEMLILALDVLRENIRDAIEGSNMVSYREAEADMTIRRWAGFLKHPRSYVFAHRCFDKTELADLDLDMIEINTEFLRTWDHLRVRERDLKKAELARSLVTVSLPDVEQLQAFFAASAQHLDLLIKANPRSKRGH